MLVRDAETHHRQRLARTTAGLTLQPLEGDQATTLWVSRGWFDVQINGFAGVDLNGTPVTRDELRMMTTRLHAEGVARYLATVITNAPETMAGCLAGIASARSAEPSLTHAVAGMHLEGPFISPLDGARGAHPLEHVRAADLVLYDELAAAAGGAIRLVTLAPEVRGAIEMIEGLRERGVTVAIGHSLADAGIIERAVAAGARLSTHLGNGAPAVLPRHPNLIWDQLADDTLYASLIFDGHHLPVSVMRVMARAKGNERTILTSDAVALARMAPGVYDAAVGGRVALSAEGRLTLAGTPYLAGSASSLLDGVDTAIRRVGLAPATALAAVGRNPRALLGIDDDDLTIVDVNPNGVEVVAVRSGGRWVVDNAAV